MLAVRECGIAWRACAANGRKHRLIFIEAIRYGRIYSLNGIYADRANASPLVPAPAFLAIGIALAYAIILAALPVDAFVDRDNYLIYAGDSLAILAVNALNGIPGVLANEPIWLLFNVVLSSFLEPESCVRVLIGLSGFLVAFVTIRNFPRHILLLLLFLLLPQILKNYVIHLRQGLAVAVFMAGWFSTGRKARWFLFMLCPFIHASFFFVIFFVLLHNVFNLLRLSAAVRLVLLVSIGLVVSLSAIWFAGLLGARQGTEYESAGAEISGIAFVFWLPFMGIFILQGGKFLKDNGVVIAVLVFYLTGYFFLPVAGRIFESALLLILLSGLQLTSYRKMCFLALFAFYFIAQWLPRLGLPGFGWGVENFV